ncbi:MAG: MFS transporter [Anaerolineaceae bacterium]
MKQKWDHLLHEYPRPFRVLIGALFVDRWGGALIFPFLSLYVTQRFQVGMVEVGTIFAIFSIGSLFGNLLGGALTDKIGRRAMLIFGLVASAGSTLMMGLVNHIEAFYIGAAFVGLLADTAGPAQQAMVADLLPEAKRTEGFGILRVVANLAVTIGPAIGGVLAAYSFLSLFIIDACASTITAMIVYFTIPETKPEVKVGEPHPSLVQTFTGYKEVFRDRFYMVYLLVAMLMVLVYMQMNTTLSVYLRDAHQISTQQFGYLISLNAAMVVLFQFGISRRIQKYAPMVVMGVGTIFYAVGFAMYGFTHTYLFFLLAMAIITIGEMLVSPVGQALVSRLAPEDKRGRYMAVYGLSWLLPSSVGPLAAGWVMDTLDPRWVWYACGILGVIASLGYFALNTRTRDRFGALSSEETPAD